MIDVLENGDKILYRVLYGSFLAIGGIFIFVVLVFLGVKWRWEGFGWFFWVSIYSRKWFWGFVWLGGGVRRGSG